MRQSSGFTLIEVVVVVAILAILTGIMVPMMYRVWESGDEDLTISRLKDLQIALVGDSRLFQNGVRTHFGYVGDLGALPASLAELAADPGGLANWKGPYLPSGFDAATYDKDAWGQPIEYVTALPDGDGRYYEALLRSIGPDGISGNADDSTVMISVADVLPLQAIQGNVNITFPSDQASRSIGIIATYRNGSGNQVTETCCDTTHLVSGGTGTTYSQYFSCALNKRLPAGTVVLAPNLYDNNCATSVVATARSVAAAVSSSTLFVNLQIQ